jgi:TATA-binding protein-associated factor Taf7
MSRKSLRPQMNQIRTWVRQGRTDAWIAHQLEATVAQIQSFKREHGLVEGDGEPAPEEIDLRAEDDAAIAAQLEEEERKRREEEETRAAEEAAREAAEAEEGDAGEGAEEAPKPKRRARGGRRRKADAGGALEGTFDHGEEGYGLWLDPAVQDDPVYAEHWAGHRPVTVTIEEDQIVIRRAGGDEDSG